MEKKEKGKQDKKKKRKNQKNQTQKPKTFGFPKPEKDLPEKYK